MSAVLFVVMNCSSSFSDEKTENGKTAVQQILARVAVRICMYMPISECMCMPISENNIRVACYGACSRPRSIDLEHSTRAYFKAGAMPASSRDLWPEGVP